MPTVSASHVEDAVAVCFDVDQDMTQDRPEDGEYNSSHTPVVDLVVDASPAQSASVKRRSSRSGRSVGAKHDVSL